MKARAFTLIEVISLTVIVGVTAAFVSPCFDQARLDSRAGKSRDNLRGFWRGLMLYRSDYDSRSEVGTPEEMGLPANPDNWMAFVKKYTQDSGKDWTTKRDFTPCGTDNDEEMKGMGLGYMALVDLDWKQSIQMYKGSSVLLFDKNCNMPGTRVLCQLCDKRSIGITLDGEIRDRQNANWTVLNQKFYR